MQKLITKVALFRRGVRIFTCMVNKHCEEGWHLDSVAIEKKGFFGTKKEPVDLDASCAVYDDKKNHIDSVNFRKLQSNDHLENKQSLISI